MLFVQSPNLNNMLLISKKFASNKKYVTLLVCLIGLLCEIRIANATPADWCARPEAKQYITDIDEPMLRPGSGVKKVFYPKGMRSHSEYPVTYNFLKSGLLDSIATDYKNGDNCTDFFRRGQNAILEKIETICSNKSSYSPVVVYSYLNNGWNEKNDSGNEVTAFINPPESSAKWTIHSENIDRKSPTAPGAFFNRSYTENCIPVGTQSYPEPRMAFGKGAVNGPIITLKINLKSDKSGYNSIRTGEPYPDIFRQLDVNGLLIKEIVYNIDRPRDIMATIDISYKKDKRGNWLERKEIHTAVEDGGKISESVVQRIITYY